MLPALGLGDTKWKSNILKLLIPAISEQSKALNFNVLIERGTLESI
jgi:hypothetical protein